jgi:dihydroflavonol-4-reductase
MIDRDHLPAVIVNPAAPLGPGDVRPTPTGRIVLEALRGRMPAFVDTGLDVVHVDDVAQGHIAALEHGKIGEKYILGGDNIDLATLLGEIAALTARRAPRLRLPRAPLLPLAYLNEFVARFTGHDPFLNVEGLRLSGKSMFFNDAKARNELGYRSRPYGEAIADAVRWFQAREDEKASGAAALRLTGQ